MGERKLTVEQEKFCRLYIVENKTLVNAYKMAYGVEGDNGMATLMQARFVRDNARVQARIRELQIQLAEGQVDLALNAERLRNMALSQIAEMAETGDGSALQLRAAIALAKMPRVGLYDAIGAETDSTRHLSDKQLQDMFLQLATTIKGRMARKDATDVDAEKDAHEPKPN